MTGMTRLVLLAALSLGGCDDDDTTNDPVTGADARPATTPDAAASGPGDGGTGGLADAFPATPDGGSTGGTPDGGI